MSALIQIGQPAPGRSLLEMIQELAAQEHQMIVEARRKAETHSHRRSTRGTSVSAGRKMKAKTRPRASAC